MNFREVFRKNLDAIKKGVKRLLKSKYFYIALFIFLVGSASNLIADVYLHNFVSDGNKLPLLSDLILDNIPYWEISFLYDWFAFSATIIFVIYVIYKKEYKKLPYILLMFGFLYIVRSVFVVLTPFGNPRDGIPTDSIFHGFSKYEMGVYPSGHTGGTFMYFLLAKGIFRWLLFFITLAVISSLLLARGHYSIDILSGLIFAYAIYCNGEKYFRKKFELKN